MVALGGTNINVVRFMNISETQPAGLLYIIDAAHGPVLLSTTNYLILAVSPSPQLRRHNATTSLPSPHYYNDPPYGLDE